MNNTPLEKYEQEAFCQYCENMGIVVCSIPNGLLLGSRKNYAYIKSLKKQGFKSGFPDLQIFAYNKSRTHQIFFVEMKRQSKGRLSPEQKQWNIWLNSNGYKAVVAYGCNHAIQLLNEYLLS